MEKEDPLHLQINMEGKIVKSVTLRGQRLLITTYKDNNPYKFPLQFWKRMKSNQLTEI